jgi:hypothetical protein
LTTYRDRLNAGLHDSPNAAGSKTVDQLKTALAALGQPTTGNKTELEKRLKQAQKNA